MKIATPYPLQSPLLGPADMPDKYGYRGGRMESDSLTVVGGASSLAPLVERTRQSLHDAIPANTRRAYEGDLRRFAAWCTATGLAAMPASPETIVVYLRHLADEGRRMSTIDRALAAISTAHVRAGFPSPWQHPLVDDMRTALRRELGVRPNKKRAADDEVLRQLLAVLPTSLLGLRDRALLTLCWSAALRRSELVALDVEHVTRATKGLVVLVAQSKTDQEHRGEEVPVFFANSADCCPVRSLDAWLATAGIAEGAVFRALGRRERLGSRLAPAAVADRVQHWAKLAGLDWREFAGHSLRSGFVTTAARRGKDARFDHGDDAAPKRGDRSRVRSARDPVRTWCWGGVALMPRKPIRDMIAELQSWLPNYDRGPRTSTRRCCFASSRACPAAIGSKTSATSRGTSAGTRPTSSRVCWTQSRTSATSRISSRSARRGRGLTLRWAPALRSQRKTTRFALLSPIGASATG